MVIVKVLSKISGRIVEKDCSVHELLDAFDYDTLVQRLTECECQPIGETNVVECGCYEEWFDYDLFLDGEKFEYM